VTNVTQASDRRDEHRAVRIQGRSQMSMKPNFIAYPTLRAGATRAAGEGTQATPADAWGKATTSGSASPEPTEWTDKLELR
jgi:hypothetical protein